MHVLEGVKQVGALTVTSAMRGAFKNDPELRQEFRSLSGSRAAPDCSVQRTRNVYPCVCVCFCFCVIRRLQPQDIDVAGRA